MTSRCRNTGLPSYSSKTRAEKAITKNPSLEGGRPFRCGCNAWHIEGTRGDDRRKRQPDRFDRVEWDEATLLLWARSRGACEWCGRPLGNNLERHHRQVREVGGDRLSNLLALHTDCHVPGVHAHPEEARERGAIVSRHAADPSAVALLLPDGRSVFLTDDGGVLAA